MSALKLKQFAVSLLVVLSLFASSVSACVCDHHSVQNESSDHYQPEIQTHHHESGEVSHHETSEAHHSESAETGEFSFLSSDDECCCIQSAPKVFAKSETVKTEKQVAKILPPQRVETVLIAQIASVKSIEFASPFYLSDSFYNISPGRAPPRL
jgi:hypothetical protein